MHANAAAASVSVSADGDGDRSGLRTTPTQPDLAAWARALGHLPADVSDAQRIDRIRLLEELKSAAAAAQAVTTAQFARSQRAANGLAPDARPGPDTDRDAGQGGGLTAGGDGSAGDGADGGGVPAGRARCDGANRGAGGPDRVSVVARSVAGQVALARKESPWSGAGHVRLADVLVQQMPHTLAALAAGTISEWRAALICRETGFLSEADRAVVDGQLVGELAGAGDRRVARLARAAACRLDPAGAVARAGRAARDRRVTIRPAPDTMSYLTALLPVQAGVAVYAALRRGADSVGARGDERSRSQLMADLLVDHITNTNPTNSNPTTAAAIGTTAGTGTDPAVGTAAVSDVSGVCTAAANPGVGVSTLAGVTTAAGLTGTASATMPTGLAGSGRAKCGGTFGRSVDDGDPDGLAGDGGVGVAAGFDPVAAVRAAYAAAVGQDRDHPPSREHRPSMNLGSSRPATAGLTPPTASPPAGSDGAAQATGSFSKPTLTVPGTAVPGASPPAPPRPAKTSPSSATPPVSVLPTRPAKASPPESLSRVVPACTRLPSGMPVEIGLVMTDQALFGHSDEPALLGGEVIPAQLARALLADLPATAKTWIRRLYAQPATGQLAAMDSRHRLFDNNVRRFVLLRDQTCRTPWCDAPIRHADHARPASRGGPTTTNNGDGLSEDCNYIRQAPGWTTTTGGAAGPADDIPANPGGPAAGHTLTITTPTGHHYTTAPPALPGHIASSGKSAS